MKNAWEGIRDCTRLPHKLNEQLSLRQDGDGDADIDAAWPSSDNANWLDS